MASAEQAYLFRHVLLRDAAYQLQLPGDRARLHALAVASVESLFSDRDTFAEELAEHCHLALEGDERGLAKGSGSLREKEAGYLRVAAEEARRGYQMPKSIALFARLCSLPSLTLLQRAEAGTSLAAAQNELGDTVRCEATALAALRGYENARLPPTPRLLRILCSSLRRQNRLAEAAPHCLRALKLAQEACDRVEVGHALQSLALLRQEERRFDEALRHFDEALEISIERRDRQSECQVRINRGMTLEDLGRKDEARAEYQTAEAIARETGSEHEVAMALGNTASITADPKEACKLFRAALSIFRRMGSKRMMGTLLPSLGNLLGPMGELAEAEALGREAVEIAQEVDDPRLAPLAHGSLARNLSRAGRDLEALEHGRMALALHRKLGKGRSISIALENLAHFCRRCGMLDESLAHYVEALAIRREQGRQREAAINLAHQALVLAESRRNDEAAERWRQARELAGEGARESFAELREELARANLWPQVRA